MKTHLYNEICQFKKNFGRHEQTFWHNDLEKDCDKHVSYMAYHQICQHAPDIILNGAFECVAYSFYYHNISNEVAINRLLYDNLAHSINHMNLILNSHHFAAAHRKINTDNGAKHYLCIRGY